tara:strand:- start:53518 stop:53958 length:441 start_codon:yes stop_codon:yes gene_type:complete
MPQLPCSVNVELIKSFVSTDISRYMTRAQLNEYYDQAQKIELWITQYVWLPDTVEVFVSFLNQQWIELRNNTVEYQNLCWIIGLLYETGLINEWFKQAEHKAKLQPIATKTVSSSTQEIAQLTTTSLATIAHAPQLDAALCLLVSR